ncbi:MAG: hypothetical protein ABEJ83_02920 [Candidatus Nanohaloarchaea archaeon]
MAPQTIWKYINRTDVSPQNMSFRPEVEHAARYGEAMTDAARRFQLIVVAAWASSFLFIFTQRLIRQEKPFEINVGGKTVFKIPKPGIIPEKYIKHLDNILFTLNFTLLSYLFVLQFMQYGMIKVRSVGAP